MTPSLPRSAGFSLVEITLALGVAAVSLLAVFGLLAAGAQTNRSATEQTRAVNIISAVATDLRATPSALSRSLQYHISIPANPVSRTSTTLYFDSSGQSSTALRSNSRYRLVVTFLPNGSGRAATLVALRLTWPAAADPGNATTGSAEVFTALDRS